MPESRCFTSSYFITLECDVSSSVVEGFVVVVIVTCFPGTEMVFSLIFRLHPNKQQTAFYYKLAICERLHTVFAWLWEFQPTHHKIQLCNYPRITEIKFQFGRPNRLSIFICSAEQFFYLFRFTTLLCISSAPAAQGIGARFYFHP